MKTQTIFKVLKVSYMNLIVDVFSMLSHFCLFLKYVVLCTFIFCMPSNLDLQTLYTNYPKHCTGYSIMQCTQWHVQWAWFVFLDLTAKTFFNKIMRRCNDLFSRKPLTKLNNSVGSCDKCKILLEIFVIKHFVLHIY